MRTSEIISQLELKTNIMYKFHLEKLEYFKETEVDFVMIELNKKSNRPHDLDSQMIISNSGVRSLYIFRDPNQFYWKGVNGTRNGTLYIGSSYHRGSAESGENLTNLILDRIKDWPTFMSWSLYNSYGINGEHGENFRYYINIKRLVSYSSNSGIHLYNFIDGTLYPSQTTWSIKFYPQAQPHSSTQERKSMQ